MNRSAVVGRESLRPAVAGWCAAAATVLVVYVAVVRSQEEHLRQTLTDAVAGAAPVTRAGTMTAMTVGTVTRCASNRTPN